MSMLIAWIGNTRRRDHPKARDRRSRRIFAIALGSALALPGVMTATPAVAATPSGTVVPWGGQNYWGESTVPTGLSGVVAVAGGGVHSLALKSDGTVAAWGHLDAAIPAGLTDVIAIAAGSSHSLGLKSDGTVVAWGADYLVSCAGDSLQ